MRGRGSARWLVGGLLGVLALPACGPESPPSADTTKTVPVLPERYQRRDLETWVALPEDAPAEERAAQAWALAALVDDPIRAAPLLLRLLADEDASVRLSAVIAAGRLAPPSKRLAEVLVGFFDSDEEPLRRHARSAVARFGAEAVPPLLAALEGQSLRERWGAAQALYGLGRAGAPAVDRLASMAASDPHKVVRRQARFTLARLGPKGAAACAGFLASQDASERDEAAAALRGSGRDGLAPLLRLVQGEHEVAAAVAAGVIADLGAGTDLGAAADPAVVILIKALEREGPVRFNAMSALVGIGAPAVERVRALAEQGPDNLREVARQILKGIAQGE